MEAQHGTDRVFALAQTSDLVNSYSFNTELSLNKVPQSVTVVNSNGGISFQGGATSAPLVSDPVLACKVSDGSSRYIQCTLPTGPLTTFVESCKVFTCVFGVLCGWSLLTVVIGAQIAVIPIDGLLVPSTKAPAPTTSSA